jgi:ribonuclease P protein component
MGHKADRAAPNTAPTGVSGAPSSFRFPKSARLLKRREFLRVQRRGSRVHGRGLTLIGMPGLAERGRVGITVPKKVGGAVVRNKIKRRIRHWLRHHQPLFLKRDLVVMVHPEAARLTWDQLSAELLSLFEKLARQKPDRGRRTSKRRGKPQKRER